jgi:nucleotide-binding universal stress UspA family protein
MLDESGNGHMALAIKATHLGCSKGGGVMDRLLLAVDGSEHATRAAGLAGHLSRCLKSRVDIIHVVPETTPVMSGPVHEYSRIEELYITQRDLLESVGRKIVDEAARMVREAGGRVGYEEVVIGHPATDIVDAANRFEADAIVMGRRGLGDIKGLFMGSVSHRVGQLSEKTLITTE